MVGLRRRRMFAGDVKNQMALPKRLIVGRPLSSSRLGETLLPKKLALPVFCSDPLSSNAYATEEILLVLSLGGLSLLHLSPWVALCVVMLLVIVVLSYRQTCHAYPNGGGAYTVSKANLGRRASLVAASALLVDYVLTVAVSVAAGVANVVSAVPSLAPHAVGDRLCDGGRPGPGEPARHQGVGHGVRDPDLRLRAVRPRHDRRSGSRETVAGHPPTAESAAIGIEPEQDVTGLLLVAVLLRAFASGCTALTGVEAVSNGVPNFQRPKARNAASTLAVMGGLTIVMFVGITALALISDVHVAHDASQLIGAPDGYTQRTVIAQIGGAVFGMDSSGSTRSRASRLRSWSWPRTRPSTASPCWRPSWPTTTSCRASSLAAAIGWCSPTASSSCRDSRSR